MFRAYQQRSLLRGEVCPKIDIGDVKQVDHRKYKWILHPGDLLARVFCYKGSKIYSYVPQKMPGQLMKPALRLFVYLGGKENI
jgi:hypothetical protein